MSNVKRMVQLKLGEILLREGAISQESLGKALQVQQEQGKLIGDVLFEMGMVSEQVVAEAIANQFSLPYLTPSQCMLQRDIIEELPMDFLRQNVLLPLDRFGDFFLLLIGGMLDQKVLDQIEQTTGCQVQAYVSTRTEILNALDKFQHESESQEKIAS